VTHKKLRNENPEMTDVTRVNYQQLKDIAARVDPEEGIRQGLEDIKNGKIRRPAREFFAEFEVNQRIGKQASGRPPGWIRH
jgi:hypothetical protein